MIRVVVDTNALMMPVEVGVRTLDELERLLGDVEAVVPRAVREELEALSGDHGDEATAASVGVDLVDTACQVVDHEAEYADDAVVELGEEADYVVTNDGPLRDRVLASNVPVISLRGRNKLEITQP